MKTTKETYEAPIVQTINPVSAPFVKGVEDDGSGIGEGTPGEEP